MYKVSPQSREDRLLKPKKATKTSNKKDRQDTTLALAEFIYDVYKERKNLRSVESYVKAKPSNRPM